MNSSDDAFLRKVRAIQAERDNAIQPLAAVLAERQRLSELLSATDGPYGTAYADATAAGWRPDELAALGAEEPTRRPKGRPRKPASGKGRIPVPGGPGQQALDRESEPAGK